VEGAPKVGVPLTEEWGLLRAGIPERHHRKVLSSPIRFWSAQGLTPGEVDEAALSRCMRYRGETTRLVANDAARRRIARAWNACVGVVEGWPKQRLIEPAVKPLMGPAWEAFPQGLRQEIEHYLAGLTKIRRSASGKRIRPCKPTTIRTRLAELQAFARMAVRQGFAIASLTSLSAMLDPDLVEKVIDAYWNKDEAKPRIYVIDLGWKLLSIARETSSLPEHQLARLNELRETLEEYRTGGLTDKNLALIRKALTDSIWDEVLNLPAALMEEARLLRDQAPVKAAVTAQLAAAIAILCVAPVRLINLVSIKIGYNLIKPGGLCSPYWLVFPDYEVKNRVKLEFPFDQELSDLIAEYIHDFRPALLRGSNEDWLFPGQSRAIKTAGTISLQITKRIFKATGLRITVHQFRHAAGAVFLKHHPGEYVLVQHLLGHKSVQTTIRFYVGLASTQASELFGKIIRGRITKDQEDSDDDA
jgi:integrase